MTNLNSFLIALALSLLCCGFSVNASTSACMTTYNHTKNQTEDRFQTNLQTLFGKFRTKAATWSYNFNSAGESPDQAYGLYLCRGDTTSDLCNNCITALTGFFPTNGCRESFAYSDNCMIHYANYSFSGISDDTVPGIEFDKFGAANFGEYNITLAGVVEGLITDVGNISAVFTMRYGTREARVGGGDEKVYGLAQCTPDISQGECSECLKAGFAQIQGCCGGTKEAWAMLPSCQLRYDNTSFYMVSKSAATANSPAVSATFLLVACWGLFLVFN